MKKKNIVILFTIIMSLYSYSLAEEADTVVSEIASDTTEQFLVDEPSTHQSLNESTELELEPVNEKASKKDHIFSGFEMNLGYVSKNMWAGFQFSNGPCIQSITKLSFWKFNIGAYWNMIGSEEDRIKLSTGGYKTDKAARGFGMIDEVQFFIEGGNTWKKFTLESSIWFLAYTGDDSTATEETIMNDSTIIEETTYSVYNWWGKYISSEAMIKGDLQFGPLTIFSEHFFTVFARDNEKTEYDINDSTGAQEEKKVSKGNNIGAYHGAFGATITKEVEKIDLEFTVKAEYAPFNFLKSFIWSEKDREKEPSGIYHITLRAAGAYTPLPPLKIDGFFNVQFMTNKDLDKAMGYDGCIPYGGLILTYSWNRK